MAFLGHGILSSKEFVLGRSWSSSTDYGNNFLKKKLGYQLKKKRCEMKIKLSQYTQRKEEGKSIITKVSIHTRKVHLKSDVIHVMK